VTDSMTDAVDGGVTGPPTGPATGPPTGTVHVLVPAVVADPSRPSGGNAYDRRVATELTALGLSVHEHLLPGAWPHPRAEDVAAFATTLGAVPAGRTVLLDGLVASAAADVVTGAAARLRVVVLVHLPLGVADVAPRGPEATMLRRVAAVLVTSAWTRRWLVDEYAVPADRITVALPGTDRSDLAAGTPASGALLCVGAVTPTKGHDLLVEALSDIGTPRWSCSCVGSLDVDPGFVAGLRTRVDRAGLADRVTFTGVLRGDDLETAYRQADVLVLPSRIETYGMVVTEALAHGLPVLGFRTGGVPETLGRAPDGSVPGVLVPAGDAATLGIALRTWLEDPGLRARMREAAHLRRQSLPSWADTAGRVAALLAGRGAS
jgi:glycosyltransferase involved in cell wall biosynthesis